MINHSPAQLIAEIERLMDMDYELLPGARHVLEEAIAVIRPLAEKSETVNHPPHYNAHPSGVECITVVEHYGFNVGNAIKYLWRAGQKSPDPLEDLRKAAWYVNREIARLSAGS